MKSRYIPTLAAAFGLTAHAAETPDSAIITDPSKIVESTTYDLGNRLLTVQEVTKEALPMPEIPPPPGPQPATAPDFEARPLQEFGFLNLGGSVYRRTGQPTRSLINYRFPSNGKEFSFWTSADWSLLASVGGLTDSNGKSWQLMFMYSVYEEEYQEDSLKIPEFPAGKSTIQIVSGNPTPEELAPVKLFLAYYDEHLPELQAAYKNRVEEQERLAAEEKAHPKVPEDIVVQYRILAPEEIVPAGTTNPSGN